MDHLVRATAAEGYIRAFAVSGKEMVEKARSLHDLSPVAAAALGRTLLGAVMMGSMMKDEQDLLTIQIRGDGPIGGIVVTADSLGHAKGYVFNPGVMLPPNEEGKLDVGGAVGHGTIQVIKDLGLKEPYAGSCDLISGEIAEDITCYFAQSEQVPSSVGLGVLMEKNNTVRQAGGFIIQLMPFTPDEYIDALEKKLHSIFPVTTMLDHGMGPEEILDLLLGDMKLQINDTMEVSFQCDCSKERVANALAGIGKKDLQEMIDDGKDVEAGCHFCGKKYVFTTEELKTLLREGSGHTEDSGERSNP